MLFVNEENASKNIAEIWGPGPDAEPTALEWVKNLAESNGWDVKGNALKVMREMRRAEKRLELNTVVYLADKAADH